MNTHYQVLGLCSDAAASDIKAAYHSLALSLHPDKTSDANSLERFQHVQQAYEVSVC